MAIQTCYPSSGDSLSDLAYQTLGSVSNFRELATFNNLNIFQPIVGQQIQIPSTDQLASMVQAYINQNNPGIQNPAVINNYSGLTDPTLDLSGMYASNSAWGEYPYQLISWLSQ